VDYYLLDLAELYNFSRTRVITSISKMPTSVRLFLTT